MCDLITNPLGCATDAVGSTVGSAVDAAAGNAMAKFAESVSESVAGGLAALGTLWVNIGTPNLAEGTSAGRNAGATPPGADGIETVLSYMLYVGLGVCVLSLMVAGARIAMAHRQTDGGVGEEEARVGVVLMATIVISAASSLIGGLFRGGRIGQAGETVAFLQNSLWFYVLVLAMVSVVLAGIRMAWEQRAQPGRDLVKSLMTLLLVVGSGTLVIGILSESSDAFSEWIITGALDCDPTTGDGSCFERNLAGLIALSGVSAPFTVIVFGLVALVVSLVQIMLMVARAGMLVILTGILPLTAAATNTEMGGMWFKRSLSWLIAWLLYKPAAAIVYATAFHLVGTDIFKNDETSLIKLSTGVMLMLLAILALPALMKFVTPAVGAMAAAGGGAMTMAAAAAPAVGAISATGRQGASGAADQAQAPASPSGSDGQDATGASPAGGGGGSADSDSSSNGQGPQGGPSGSGGPSPAASSTSGGAGGAEDAISGATGGGNGVAAAASSGASGAGGGAAAAGGGASAAGGAAAAAGPAGAAIVAADGVKKAAEAAQGAAQSTADGATNSTTREGES